MYTYIVISTCLLVFIIIVSTFCRMCHPVEVYIAMLDAVYCHVPADGVT